MYAKETQLLQLREGLRAKCDKYTDQVIELDIKITEARNEEIEA